MMVVKFVVIKENHDQEVIKESKSDYLVIPNICGQVTIGLIKYMVMGIDYNYDLGVITVRLYQHG